jgi:hypothetical protein
VETWQFDDSSFDVAKFTAVRLYGVLKWTRNRLIAALLYSDTWRRLLHIRPAKSRVYAGLPAVERTTTIAA